MKTRKITKAVFPVAGLGTRFLPATKSIPKEIMTLVDRPLIQYAIDEARAAGIREFIFVTSRGKSALEDYFDVNTELEAAVSKPGKEDLLKLLEATNMDSGAIAYVRQNRPMGLGHAVWCARRLIGDEPFAVILPDDVIAADKTKMRVAHRVPLSRQVLAILEELREISGNRRYLFPAQGKRDRPMCENTINLALRRMGFDGTTMTAHGFRAMASTLLNEQGHWNPDAIERLLAGLAGRAVLVVDEAYAEYSTQPSAIALLGRFTNLVVLRTLSKAYALAGARLGITLADPALVRVLSAIAPPYPLAAPAVALALEAVSPAAADEAKRRAGRIVAERERVAAALAALPAVRRVYASDANYLLVRFADAEAAFRALLAAGVVVRDQRAQPGLHDALRLTIGSPEENEALLAALAALPGVDSP